MGLSGSSSIVVQKYGGTSLGTAEKMEKVLGIVNNTVSEGNSVALVVSALSSHTKAEGTTSRLLAAAESAVLGKDPVAHAEYLERIEDTHLEVLYALVDDKEIRNDVVAGVRGELKHVRNFCDSISIIQELSTRSHDLIVGAGERLSAMTIAAVLSANGVQARYVNLSHLFTSFDVSQPGYHLEIVDKIHDLVTPVVREGAAPVVTGYMGHFSGGIVNAVGRGYTDLTAALVSAALGADKMQVWKESDGVFTGNPTKLVDVRLLQNITPKEAAELTYFGNEVLHPFTMDRAMEADVPIHILNTFKPESGGTVIDPNMTLEEVNKDPNRGNTAVTAVCSKGGISVISITSNRKAQSFTFLKSVFSILEDCAVKVDLVSASEATLSMTINEGTAEESIVQAEQRLAELGDCKVLKGRGSVSAIGEGMANEPGMAAKMFKALSERGINIEMIAQGANEINMSCVIKDEDRDRAIEVLNKHLMSDVE